MVVRVSVDDSEDNYHKGYKKLTVNHSPLQNYTYLDDHIQYTYSSKVVTWGFPQAPMTMAECIIILNRLQIIGDRFLCGSGVVVLESGGPSACPVFVLSALKSLNRSQKTCIYINLLI